MDPIEDFVLPILACINEDFKWPAIPPLPFPEPPFDLPNLTGLLGFPGFLMGSFGSMFAGINLILPFIPPDIENLPSFTIPDINIFIDGFLNSMIGLPSFPAFSIDLPGLSLSIPAFSGVDLPPLSGFQMFSPEFLLKFMAVNIAVPFFCIKLVLDSIFELSIKLPTLQFIIDLIIDLSVSIGIPELSITQVAGCLGNSFLTMIETLIPV